MKITLQDDVNEMADWGDRIRHEIFTCSVSEVHIDNGVYKWCQHLRPVHGSQFVARVDSVR